MRLILRWLRYAAIALTWLATLFCGAWAVIRIFGLEPAYPGGVVMAATPYVAAASVVPLLSAAALRRWVLAACAGAVVAILAVAVVPRAIPSGTVAPQKSVALRVLTINGHYGQLSASGLTALVKRDKVDLVSLQEVSPELLATLRQDGLRKLLPHVLYSEAGKARYRYGTTGPDEASSTGTGDPLPSTPTALLSRYPLSAAPEDFSRSGQRSMPAASLDIPGAAPIEVKAVHIVRPLYPQLWERELHSLPTATPQGPMRVLIGDFNATLDHAAMRSVLDHGYNDAASLTGAGLIPTWPHCGCGPRLFTVDHILVDHRIAATTYSIHALEGSRHLAIETTLALPHA